MLIKTAFQLEKGCTSSIKKKKNLKIALYCNFSEAMWHIVWRNRPLSCGHILSVNWLILFTKQGLNDVFTKLVTACKRRTSRVFGITFLMCCCIEGKKSYEWTKDNKSLTRKIVYWSPRDDLLFKSFIKIVMLKYK